MGIVHRQIRVFKFFRADTDELKWHEILIDRPFSYDAIGAGEDRFRELLEADLKRGGCRVNFLLFNRLRDIIREKSIPSVGGAIQCGAFTQSTEFHLCGVLDYQKDGDRLIPRSSVLGLEIEKIHMPETLDDFYVHYSYKVPFVDDIRREFDHPTKETSSS